MKNLETSIENTIQAILQRVPSIILGLLILFVGIYLIKIILRIVKNRFDKNNVDLSLRNFIISIVKFALYSMLFLSCASTMGIQTTSFLAVLSAASLAVGLSLQGSLSNFAGGVLILLFKPFRTGDNIISGSGAAGTVERIDILYTILRTGDGITVFSPNGPLANSIITNYTHIQTRKVEYKIDISTKADIKKVRSIVMEVINNDERVLPNPAPQVLVNQITGNAVNLIINFWVSKNDYGSAFHQNQELIKESLDANNIDIYSPQPEIHIYNQDKGK